MILMITRAKLNQAGHIEVQVTLHRSEDCNEVLLREKTGKKIPSRHFDVDVDDSVASWQINYRCNNNNDDKYL